MKKNRLLIIAIVVAISLILLMRMNFLNRMREKYQAFNNADIEGIITRNEGRGGFDYVTIGDSSHYVFFSLNHDLSIPSFYGLAKKGDFVRKKSKSDTLFLIHEGVTHTYGFKKFK